MLYILSDTEILFVDLSANHIQEINNFLKPEIDRIQSATKKDYSICYKKEADEIFCISDYKNQLLSKEPNNKIISLFSDILTRSTNSFKKANLDNIFSIDMVIFKTNNMLFIQSGINAKIINKRGFWKKLLIDTNYDINHSVFLSLGNKINAMYQGKDLYFDSTYGLRALSLSKFTKELSYKEICANMPSNIKIPALRSFNRKNSRMLSLLVQDPKYFSLQHLKKSQKLASKFNISFPFNGTQLVLPNNQMEIENILAIITDTIFQSNYESNIVFKANSVEKIS